MVCGIYCRVSSEAQRDNYSIQDQRDDGVAFAKSKSMEYIIYEDVRSGTDITREGWVTLNKAIDDKEVDFVWVGAIDRFSRDTQSGLQAVELMRQRGVKLFVAGQFYDLADDSVELLISVQFQFAKYEWRRILSRMAGGRRRYLNEGRRKYNQYTYGYDKYYDDNGKIRYRINDEEKKVVEYIYQLFNTGDYSIHRIAEQLNSEGIPTAMEGKEFMGRVVSGSPWQNRTVNNILSRELYAGLVWDADHTKLMKSTEYEPIFTLDYWEMTQDNLKNFNRIRFRKDSDSTSYLSGVVYCKHCFAKYYYVNVKKKGRKPIAYLRHDQKTEDQKACPNDKYIRLDYIERAATMLLFMQFENPGNVSEFIESETKRLSQLRERNKSMRERWSNRLDELGKEKTRLIQMVQKGILDMDDVAPQLEEVRKEQTKATAKLEEMKNEVEETIYDIKRIKDQFTIEKLEKWLDDNINAKRKLYRSLLSSWLYDAGEHIIRWKTGQERKIYSDWQKDDYTKMLIDLYTLYEREDYSIDDVKRERNRREDVDNFYGMLDDINEE
jgi:site-specific DNA recombinase